MSMAIPLLRNLLLLVPMIAVGAAYARKQPDRRQFAAACLAGLWCLPALLAVHQASKVFGWWWFQPSGATVLGMPADLLFAWALLWGALPVIAWPGVNLAAIVIVALGVDALYMPKLSPVVVLNSNWWWGETLSLLLVLVPAQLLGRWTMKSTQLAARASMQCLTFFGIVFVLLPAVALDPFNRPWSFETSWTLLALWSLPAITGISALQEFVERGQGTPVPFDPPLLLVRSGIYSYVRNPMQLAITLLLPAVLCHLGGWIGLLGLVSAVAYSQGFALWDEQQDLPDRFGAAWVEYSARVPRWLPLHRPQALPAELHVDAGCAQCRDLGCAIAKLCPLYLEIVPASSELRRITYTASDGYSVSGVAAVARALEHVNFGWALLGMTMRLPVLVTALQVVADMAGGGPRENSYQPPGNVIQPTGRDAPMH